MNSFLHKLIFIRPKSVYCLAVSQFLLFLVVINCWIFFSNMLDFSKFYIDNNIKLVIWISLIYFIIKVVSWIGESGSMYFSPFAKQNQVEV